MDLRIAGSEFCRFVQCLHGFSELPAEEQHLTKGPLPLGIIGIDLHGLPKCGERFFRHVLAEISCAKVHRRGKIRRIEFKRALEGRDSRIKVTAARLRQAQIISC